MEFPLEATLNRSYRFLSAGTDVIVYSVNETAGYASCALRCKPSAQLHQNDKYRVLGQRFDIEADYLTVKRPHSELVPAIPRKKRPNRVAARVVYEMRKNPS